MLEPQKSLGSAKKALQIAKQGYETILAYKDFLASKNITNIDKLEELPITNKSNYINSYKSWDLIPHNRSRSLRITHSSGTSGKYTYWLEENSYIKYQALSLKLFLESNFAIHNHLTLAIIAFHMGAWTANDSFDLNLKMMALDLPYDFYTFSGGLSQIDKIIEVIDLYGSQTKQIIIFINPSMIFYLQQRAKYLGYQLPLSKMRYIVTGENFPENFRIKLQKEAQISPGQPFLFSYYGSADTGVLGTESLASISLRKILFQNPSLAQELGFDSIIPQFFHFNGKDTFLEITETGILVTKWQTTPLFRYGISDKISLYNWKELKQKVINLAIHQDCDANLVQILRKSSDRYPDILALTGRTDNFIIFAGVNIPVYILDQIVKGKELQGFLTGIYTVKLAYQDNGKQLLLFDLETWQNIQVDSDLEEVIYKIFIDKLLNSNAVFSEEWLTLYSKLEEATGEKIIKLNFYAYPHISQGLTNVIKHKSVQSK